MKNKLKILFLSTYPPRECGIATYTKNLIDSIDKKEADIEVAAINDKQYKYSPIVRYQINQQIKSDYKKLAEKVNASDIDVVSIQHEYGIFGGFNGHMLLEFLKHLKKPVVMTMHTVSIYQEKPFKIIPKRYISRTKLVKKLIPYISKITVMTDTAKKYLDKTYNLNSNKVVVIPHGAPYISTSKLKKYRQQKQSINITEKDFIVLSWGLITPKKGLEYSVKGIIKFLKKYPKFNLKYIIAGRHHPKKPKAYLDGLKKIVRDNKMTKNIVFDSRYLTYDEVYRYLANTSIYITPYYTKEQASSGTLSYALASGCAIVSTPYIFAKDVINYHKVGKIIKFKNADSVAKIIEYLYKNQDQVQKMKANSYAFGQNITWSKIGRRFLNIFQSVK